MPERRAGPVGDDRLHRAQIGGEQHAVAKVAGHADPAQARVGHRAAQEGGLQHARQADIGEVFAAPVEIPTVLHAQHARAHALAAAISGVARKRF